MRDLFIVASREIKIGFRNPWAYSFMGLFTLFMLSLQLINTQQYLTGYSSISAMMLNLSLYLLPLMALMLGSFSLTSEKEDKTWELLSSYPLPTWFYIVGKYVGLIVVIIVIVSVGFGISGVIGWIFGSSLYYATYFYLLFFAISLSVTFLSLAFLVGSISKNRWQALTIDIAIWFFLIIAWPTLLISFLGILPYTFIKPIISFLTIINPSEITRLFVVVKMGGGATLGPEYYKWMTWINSEWGIILFSAITSTFILSMLFISYLIWERKRVRG